MNRLELKGSTSNYLTSTPVIIIIYYVCCKSKCNVFSMNEIEYLMIFLSNQNHLKENNSILIYSFHNNIHFFIVFY